MLLTLAALVFIIWIILFAASIAGGLINLLLILAVLLLIAHLVRGKYHHV